MVIQMNGKHLITGLMLVLVVTSTGAAAINDFDAHHTQQYDILAFTGEEGTDGLEDLTGNGTTVSREFNTTSSSDRYNDDNRTVTYADYSTSVGTVTDNASSGDYAYQITPEDRVKYDSEKELDGFSQYGSIGFRPSHFRTEFRICQEIGEGAQMTVIKGGGVHIGITDTGIGFNDRPINVSQDLTDCTWHSVTVERAEYDNLASTTVGYYLFVDGNLSTSPGENAQLTGSNFESREYTDPVYLFNDHLNQTEEDKYAPDDLNDTQYVGYIDDMTIGYSAPYNEDLDVEEAEYNKIASGGITLPGTGGLLPDFGFFQYWYLAFSDSLSAILGTVLGKILLPIAVLMVLLAVSKLISSR